MATIERQTVSIPATQLRKYATTLRRIRSRGMDVGTWGSRYLIHDGYIIGGDRLDTVAAVRIGSGSETDPFTVSIPHDAVTAAVKGAKGNVAITADGIMSNVGTFGWDADDAATASMLRDYGELCVAPQDQPNTHVVLSGAEYRDAVSIASLYAPKDESRPVLTGVCITRDGAWYATDSYRMIVMNPPTLGGESAELDPIVPFRALDTAARLSSGNDAVALREYGSGSIPRVLIDGMGWNVYSRLHEGQYPDLGKLIPEGAENILSLDDAGVDTLIRFCRAQKRANTTVRITFSCIDPNVRAECDGAVVFIPLTDGTGDTAGDVTIGMNPAFLADCLASMPQGGAELHVISPLRPVTFRAADHSQDMFAVTAVCMPMRV